MTEEKNRGLNFYFFRFRDVIEAGIGIFQLIYKVEKNLIEKKKKIQKYADKQKNAKHCTKKISMK